MSAFAVGDALCFLSVSHELFSEYQLFADETSPFSHTSFLDTQMAVKSILRQKQLTNWGCEQAMKQDRGIMHSVVPTD